MVQEMRNVVSPERHADAVFPEAGKLNAAGLRFALEEANRAGGVLARRGLPRPRRPPTWLPTNHPEVGALWGFVPLTIAV